MTAYLAVNLLCWIALGLVAARRAIRWVDGGRP